MSCQVNILLEFLVRVREYLSKMWQREICARYSDAFALWLIKRSLFLGVC